MCYHRHSTRVRASYVRYEVVQLHLDSCQLHAHAAASRYRYIYIYVPRMHADAEYVSFYHVLISYASNLFLAPTYVVRNI
jgi:hypothetical protein